MEELKIVNFNFQNNNKFDINKINTLCNMIKKNNIDLIGIQELTYKYQKELVNLLNNYTFIGKYRFGNFLKKMKYNENNNIITNKKVIYKKTIRLPWLIMSFKDFIRGIKERLIIPRIATIIILENNICMINTHLSSSKMPSIQSKQLKKIKKIINNYKDYKIILTGDFNMSSNNIIFTSFINSIPLKHIYITGNTWRNSTIDHVFIPATWKVLDKKIINMNEISDHNAIYVNVKTN